MIKLYVKYINMVIGVLTKRGIEVAIEDMIKEYGNARCTKIKKKFTISYKTIMGFYDKKQMYIITRKHIIFPRFVYSKLINSGILSSILNCIPETSYTDLVYTGKSNDNQTTIVNYILDNYFNEENESKGICGVTLDLQAGEGKTFIALDLIGQLKVKTFIIVPNTYLLKQWVGLLKQYFPHNKIGEYYSSNKTDGDIIVSIINSSITDEFKINGELIPYKDFYKEIGFIIFDESHLYCTDVFRKIYDRCQATYMLGLSATPNERINGVDVLSHVNIGEVLKACEIKNYKKNDITFNVDVEVINYSGDPEYSQIHINKKTEMVCIPLMIEDLTIDPDRNKLIIDELLNMNEYGLNIFVFSERRLHLEHLYELFINETKEFKEVSVPESSIILYGNSTNADIDKAKFKSKIIFTTYAYSSTGVSIDKMTGLILCTPRRSKARQFVGRIFRLNKKNNNIRRRIVDIVDCNNIFKNQYYTRRSAYLEREAVITTRYYSV